MINKAMAKEPAERYATAGEMMEALKGVSAKQSAASAAVVATAPVASKAEAKPPAKKFVEPSPVVEEDQEQGGLPAWIWWVGAVVVVLLLVFGIRAMFAGGGDETPENTEESPDSTLGSEWERPQDKMKMVYVPPGTFPMGSTDGGDDEQSVHDVTLGGEDFDGEKANYCENNCVLDWKDEAHDDRYAQTAPVGSYPEGANWTGALDMAGNVWEWVSDSYDSEYDAGAADENPSGPESGEQKVLRGGGWFNNPVYLRGAHRNSSVPANRDADIGFRCVLPGN